MKTYGTGKAGQYPKHEAEKRFHKILSMLAGVAVIAGLLLGIALGYHLFPFVFKFLPWARRVPADVYWVGTIILIVFAVLTIVCLIRALDAPVDELSKERIRYLHGGRTEALVAYSLQSLDGNWHLFNGIAMKGGGDIDHVLVGPGGLFCLSTKAHRGLYTLDSDGLVRLNGKENGDVREAQRLAMKLRDWLEARLQPDHTVKSIPFVRPVLVLPFAFIEFHYKDMNVWVLDDIFFADMLSNEKTSLSRRDIEGCVKVLKDMTGWEEFSPQIKVVAPNPT